ncbi:hypothetical protein BLA29_012631 [Euroglyphus maynei]|uniref:Uncharacterized protein n=1 Tax=Euroglyphus maynei TaxID=6958 RepID=A0A1Y3AR48_EURMA|nr:hypothetical protein BLA29_012631 [Euroglyphus maynei]
MKKLRKKNVKDGKFVNVLKHSLKVHRRKKVS